MKYSYGTNADQYLNKEGLEYLIEQLDLKYKGDSGTVDLTNYYDKAEINNLLANIETGGGSTGNDGVGIQSVELVNYELIVTLTDNTVINLGNIRGEQGLQGIQGLDGAKGDKGDKGEQGLDGTNGTDGVDGVDGVDGRGITSVVKTDTVGLVDTYTITYSDMTTSNFTVTNGKDGADGEGGSGGGASTDTYSTDEIAIGTWIDGKTIYRNVFDLGTLPPVTNNYGTKNIATGVSLSTVIDIKVIMTYSTTNIIASPSFSNVQLNPSSTHSTYVADVEKAKITLFRANNNIMFYYGKDYGSYSAILVVEYTKTE